MCHCYMTAFTTKKYLGCLIGENMIQWGVAGYSAVAMAGVFVIFSKKKKYTGLKLGFVLLNLFLLIPFAGHVLNGFSYVSNRWIWAYGMLIAYILVQAYRTVYAGHQGKTTDICDAADIWRAGTVFRIRPHGTQYHGTDDAGPGCVYSGFLRKRIYTGEKYLCGMIVAVLVTSILLNVSYQYSYEKRLSVRI